MARLITGIALLPGSKAYFAPQAVMVQLLGSAERWASGAAVSARSGQAAMHRPHPVQVLSDSVQRRFVALTSATVIEPSGQMSSQARSSWQSFGRSTGKSCRGSRS